MLVGDHYCDISGSIRNKFVAFQMVALKMASRYAVAASWRLWFVIEWDKAVWRHVASHQATCAITLQSNVVTQKLKVLLTTTTCN